MSSLSKQLKPIYLILKAIWFGLGYLILQCPSVRAHEPDLGYFLIQSQGSMIRVEAELPWTIRNAVYEFKPDLPVRANQNQLDQALFEYIQQHLILLDSRGVQLSLVKVHLLEQEGHAHQLNLEFLYQGNSVSTIRNTLLWNVVSDPVHTHRVVHFFSIGNYQTRRTQVEVILTRGIFNYEGNFIAGSILGAGLILLLLFLTLTIRKSSN